MANYGNDPEQVVANRAARVQDGRMAMSRASRREYDQYITGEY